MFTFFVKRQSSSRLQYANQSYLKSFPHVVSYFFQQLDHQTHAYREYPAYRDQRNRHISASENDRLILKTVPERVFAPILLSINIILVRPIIWPQFYIECKSWSLDLQKFAIWMFAQQIFILLPNLDKLSYYAGIGLEW